ncbi:hemin uptake protein HemP [Poseidonocella sp. HB161398]|uniref:hemin uptake protein HemP n=1 Tax=Poseidonocella sp. HB161398 TaxID=2320855 RepID=UPI001109FF13|nr:hemin uptake protein HemP [Poseidonocella sp. HB161398]
MDKPTTTALHSDLPLANARELIGEGSTAHILLDGQVYTLRITKAGKLILTK